MKIDRALLAASRRSWYDTRSPRAGPYWLQWVWTLLFCAALAVGFTVLTFLMAAPRSPGRWDTLPEWLDWYRRNLIVCLTIGITIHLAFDALGALMGGLQRVHRWGPLPRTLFFSGIPIVCTIVAWPVGMSLAGGRVLEWMGNPGGRLAILGSLMLAIVMAALFHAFFSMKGRQIEAEKRAAEARLRLLQGQIEPHFLFNTLANVLSLIDHDAPKAKQMLQAFTEYLRTSLATLRHDETALAHELDLAENYLRLLATRMEDRLRFSIEADEAARALRLPPLLLQPLVENAVHHGLEPSIEGGTVNVQARVRGQQLVIEVRDDGRGLDAAPRPGPRRGAGMALNNIRQRLLAHYGSSATLEVSAAHPGTLARLTLPLQTP
jgi:two-component sensor histidine kinase